MSWQERAIHKIGYSSMTVESNVTAHYFGNEGVHVLATAMVGLMAERALQDALQPIIPEGHGIVGVRQQTFHKAPAPIDTEVKAKVTIHEVNGKFVTYQFIVETSDGKRLADGDGDSAVVDMNRFKKKI